MIKLKEHVIHKGRDYGIELSSGFTEDYPHRNPRNSLHIKFLRHSWWFQIPQIIKPKTVWVDLSDAEWCKSEPKGYWNHIRRDYGISTFENSVHIHYGIQPGSWSSTDKKNSDHTIVWFIPWMSTRFIRKSYYDVVNQSHLRTFSEKDRAKSRLGGFTTWEKEYEYEKKYKHLIATFNDFDGEEITAKCRVEEMEWRWGTGYFKWLSWFRKPIIHRTLWISFDKETGYEKGSWKGGTMGQGIDMMPGESAQSAFNRYASEIDRYRNHGRKPRNFSNVRFDYE